MKVHNLMEDLVVKVVDELFADASRVDPVISKCLQCKMDVACYVLNRIKPEYVISGRGLIHFDDDYHDKIQLKVDIISIAAEGLKRITTVERPYYRTAETIDDTRSSSYFFNFPAVTGRVLDGKSFEPVENASVSLYIDGEPAKMVDKTWENPQVIVGSTRGSFSFMPAAKASDTLKEKKNFSFEIKVKKEGFELLEHFFNVGITSEDEKKASFNIEKTFKLEPLYIFKEDKKAGDKS